jgi:hypothetical protein
MLFKTILYGWLVSLLIIPILAAADVPLAWDSSVSQNIAGYRIYTGTESRVYGPPISIGNQTNYIVTGLTFGTYYFAVTAFDAAGNESDYSNEVSKIIAFVPTSRCDYNGDGNINTLDLQGVANAVIQKPPLLAGDINGDGSVNSLDIQLMVNVLLGKRPCP